MKSKTAKTGSAAIPMALLGGAGSGKSSLFQAMVFRTHARRWAGALASLIGPGAVTVKRLDNGRVGADQTERVLAAYQRWQGLGASRPAVAESFRLELPYRTGWLGRSVARLQLDLHCNPASNPASQSPSWKESLREARMLLFVVPFWACFPRRDFPELDAAARSTHLAELRQLIDLALRDQALRDQALRDQALRDQPAGRRASTMVLLSMADDVRCGLPELQDTWIHGPVESFRRHLTRLRKPRHLFTYLLNARRVSDFLYAAMADADPEVSRVLDLLERNSPEKPWLLPVSAFDGRLHAHVAGGASPPHDPPVPAHVELPLLLALCEHAEALL